MSHYDEQAEEFEMKQKEMVMKENGDNLHFSGEDKCKEWPCVGDEVSFPSGKGILMLNQDSSGVVIVKSTEEESLGEYKRVALNRLRKPKTPEEELRDELICEMDDSNTAYQYAGYLAEAIIKGEIKSLEYKPQ